MSKKKRLISNQSKNLKSKDTIVDSSVTLYKLLEVYIIYVSSYAT